MAEEHGDSFSEAKIESVTIRTERFFLRPMTDRDLAHVLRWWNDPEVRAAHALGAEPLALDHVREWFEAQGRRPWAWIVERVTERREGRSDDGRAEWDGEASGKTVPIGMLELVERTEAGRDTGAGGNRPLRVMELGITLDAAARGQGFGPEVVEGLTRWVLASGRAESVELTVLRANGRAVRAFEHAGFEAVPGPEGAGGWESEILRMVYDPIRPDRGRHGMESPHHS